MSRPAALAAALLAAVALAAAAGGAGPRATDGELAIGGTAPLAADPAAAAAVGGAAAYFAYVNRLGGVHGRAIAYRPLDDGGDPAQSLEAARTLVEQDGVLAVFGSWGTAPSLALRDYLNGARVPQLFAAAGAGALGGDPRRYPWTLGYRPPLRGEGRAYGRYLATLLPRARIAVLSSGADGAELLAGLRRGLGAGASRIAAAGDADPDGADLQAEVAALAASGADVLCLFGLGELAPSALAQAAAQGWRPRVVVDAASAGALARAPRGAAAGAVSSAYVKDPASPRWATDRGVALFRTVLRANGKGVPANADAMAGMAAAFTLVDALRRAGPSPTRAALLRAATTLREASNPFLLPGLVVRTTPSFRYPVAQLQLRRLAGARWEPLGGLLAAAP